jgi:hypothetical protein
MNNNHFNKLATIMQLVGQNEGVIDLHSQLVNIAFLLKPSTIIDYALGVMINQKILHIKQM